MKYFLAALFISSFLPGASWARVDQIPSYGAPFRPAASAPKIEVIGQSQMQDHRGEKIQVSRLSNKSITAVFSWLQASSLPFGYLKDCCHSRAYTMGMWLEDQKVISAKIFVTGEFQIKSPAYGTVTWFFHVAPAVLNEKNEWMILDPSTEKQAVPLEAWLKTFVPPKKPYKVYVASRFVYNDNDLENPSMTRWDASLANIAQGEMMGCEASLKNHRPLGQVSGNSL
jgi:hypothetical protein